ncbi:MAG: DUF3467 domain-containing protein [Candidatus Moranbacteria bacterium]|nr:DUF3467 domain-containing protein [Candidatus Moranbacteria bacterium]
MNQQQNDQQQNQVQIKASDEKLKGEYSNVMQILHTKEEFVLDFLNVFPPTGILNGRIILSPGHFKRMIVVMQENLKKYEEQFGNIAPSESPTDASGKIGFEERG